MTDREEFMLADYFKLVTSLYKLFDKVWCGNKKYEIGYNSGQAWDWFVRTIVTDMCRTDDWYLCDKYIDIVGGNWQRSLFELVGMFIRIKVGE